MRWPPPGDRARHRARDTRSALTPTGAAARGREGRAREAGGDGDRSALGAEAGHTRIARGVSGASGGAR